MQPQKKTMLKMVKPLRTGELLVKEGFIRKDDIHKVLLLQEKKQDSIALKENHLFGMILCDLNLITPRDNYYVLHKYNKLQSIQSALVAKNILPEEVVAKTRKDALQKNIPFISNLLNNGLVSIRQMQTLLFDLFHIPFKVIDDVIFNKDDSAILIKVLNKNQSWENKSVPFVLEKNTILFGITDPENILFIRKLNDLFPQYRFKPVFISFSQFSSLHKKLYANIKNTKLSSMEKPLDLSFLLTFQTSIKDPELEGNAIQILYERYELLRQLIGNPKRAALQNEFNEFIIQTHKKIAREYKSQIIKFSLKKEDRDVKIIAFPKR
ncbi:GspE/PulE/PilB domain-containing protein [Desulfobacula sp.]